MMVIEVQGLTRSFNNKQALKEISFQINKGSIVGLLGPNGAGKTTTIKILLGLLQADRGRVEILGCRLGEDCPGVRDRIGYMPEKNILYDHMSVEQMINFNRKFFTTWNDEFVDRYLNKFGLIRRRKCGSLSGGERKQLDLILALAHEPELVIMDEPAAGLDPLKRQELIGLILEEVSTAERTVLLSSHLLGIVEQIADEVIIINRGEVIKESSVAELKGSVKKIRVVFQHQPDPEVFETPGISDYESKGNEYLISVADNLQEVIARIQEEPLFAFEIIDQDLEDIFLQQVGEGKE